MKGRRFGGTKTVRPLLQHYKELKVATKRLISKWLDLEVGLASIHCMLDSVMTSAELEVSKLVAAGRISVA